MNIAAIYRLKTLPCPTGRRRRFLGRFSPLCLRVERFRAQLREWQRVVVAELLQALGARIR